MALLNAITITERKVIGTKRRVQGTVVIGDGSTAYTTGGIAMGAVSQYGFYRQMDSFNILGPTGGVTVNHAPTWDKSANKLQLFAETTVATNQPLIERTTAASPAAVTYAFEAWGW